MSATIFDVVSIRTDLGWNSVNDFTLGSRTPVAPRIVIDQPDWSLYSVDVEKGLAWFVELPPGFDLAPSVFAFRDQRQAARRLLQMSLDDLIDVSEQAVPPRKVIYVFSIGRCGSTLVSHILNTSPRVWGLSEPIAFPRLIMENYDITRRVRASRDLLVKLIRACTRLQFRPPAGSGRDVFALKFHSQTLFQADLYLEAMPDAAFVFLYRDALTWTKSWYQMAQKYGADTMVSGPNRFDVWNSVTAVDDLVHLSAYVDVDAPQIPLEDLIVVGWGRNMEEYTRLLNAGVPFLALRYNELNRDREASLSHLFTHCGLPVSDAIAGLAAFDKDSQAGDVVSSDVAAEAMTPAQVERARQVLSRRPTFSDPDLRLADVYS